MEAILDIKDHGKQYEWVKISGRGGSGLVYQVYDRHLQRVMAAKEMSADTAMAEQEFRLLKELRHPALPAVTDYFIENGKAYLVMEYIEGVTLQQYLDRHGKVPQDKAAIWGIAAGEVLCYLHERRNPILYRDMKPANIMIDVDEKLWVIDFGTAYCRYGPKEEAVSFAGTYGYAAPEQFEERAFERVDERSDVYGLGATIYHMLTGANPSKPPFMLMPIREYDRALSPGLERCIAKATAEDQESRHKTVNQLTEELKCFRQADKKRRIIRQLLQAVYHVLLLTFGLLFYLCCRASQLHGQAKDRESAMLLAFVILCLCGGKKLVEQFTSGSGKRISRIQNRYLTEKKGAGLLLMVLSVLFSAMLLHPPLAMAEELREEESTAYLDVVVRGEDGRKCLIRYDARYRLEGDFKLEIPHDIFEKNKKYKVVLQCVEEEDGAVKERSFYLLGAAP